MEEFHRRLRAILALLGAVSLAFLAVANDPYFDQVGGPYLLLSDTLLILLWAAHRLRPAVGRPPAPPRPAPAKASSFAADVPKSSVRSKYDNYTRRTA